MFTRPICFFWVILILLCVSCGTTPEEATQATGIPPTSMDSAWTETPTASPTFTPTLTPTPTNTPTPSPTPTPLGGSSGEIVYWRHEQNNTGNSRLNFSFYSVEVFNLGSGVINTIMTSDGETISYYSSSVSPDGNVLYLTAFGLENTSSEKHINDILYQYNFETGELQLLSVLPDYPGTDPVVFLLEEFIADISLDASKLVFNSNRDDLNNPNMRTLLYFMDLATQEINRIPDTVYQADRPRFSPDGTQIVYTGWDGDWEIYVQNIDGTGLQKITINNANDRYADWSPDGSRLVFHSNRGGNWDLFIYDLRTSETTQITFDPASDANGCWSPDGAKIIFNSTRDGDSDIFVVDVATLEVTKLVDTDTNLYNPIWVP